MHRDLEDFALAAVQDWNAATGRVLTTAIHEYRNSVYYRRRDDEQFNKEMVSLLHHIADQIDKRPQAAKDTVERALKVLGNNKTLATK